MFEYFVLGAVQGIAEWLPVSSEGMIAVVKTVFFGGGAFEDVVKLALFLHMGTFLAALLYFRHDVLMLIRETLRYPRAAEDHKKTINFLIVSTLISGAVGLGLLQSFSELGKHFDFSGRFLLVLVATLLLITGFLQLTSKSTMLHKLVDDLTPSDGLLLGVVQGFAALPGLSRSGLTVAALLLRDFDKSLALRLSFLMSLPIVLAGNIVLNLDQLTSFDRPALVGLLSSFIFGYLTIDILMRAARKMNFGWFVILFSVLTFVSAFI